MYTDTDSIIYKKQEHAYEPKLGDYLGEFTNEIDPEDGDYIVEFASAGPKNYTYKLNTGKEFCKVKGISLNYSNMKKIDFEKIQSIVISTDENLTETVTQTTNS